VSKTSSTCATGMAPSDAGRAVRRQGLKTVVVVTRIMWRLTARVVPLGGSGLTEELEGAWRLAARGDR